MVSDASLAFLQTLVETPSPSGFEGENAAHFRDYVAPFADTIRTDPLGSVIAEVKGSALNGPRIMLAGHIDEIGFLVHYVSDEGMLYFKPIGGHDTAVIVGQRVTIQTQTGPVPGVIGKKPIHLLLPDERNKATELFDMWIDVGAINGRDEVKEMGVQVGDCVTYAVGLTRLAGNGDRITARALDNRIGAWVVAEALRRVKDLNPQASVFAVATVQEEIGLRGAHASAFGVEADLGIAVDVTFATDYPSMDKRRFSELKIGSGPTVLRGANANRKLAARIAQIAQEKNLPLQPEATGGGTGTDANAMQISRGGMVTGIIGVPLRYMHTPCEIISLSDADNAAQLLAEVCASVTTEDVWTP